MRTTTLLNDSWTFVREADSPAQAAAAAAAGGMAVTLPHTWNAEDSLGSEAEYYRGRCWYVRALPADVPEDSEVWLEFRGAAMTAKVYADGALLCTHKGGYSTFRVEITDALRSAEGGIVTLMVSVDNSRNEEVYPQKADFTFYGGLYRDVYLITVPKTHFALDDHGSSGIQVTARPQEDLHCFEVTVEAKVSGPADKVRFTVDGRTLVSKVTDGRAGVIVTIGNAHLWDGLRDPYLYTAAAEIPGCDKVGTTFGLRRFSFDPEKGFFLNGHSYPLCGAARHQDRQGVGSAITKEMMEEDLQIMLEMGANTIRLSHYQHDQYFYDLCDRAGMLVWVEIPYITQHMQTEAAKENTQSQMTELILQNNNHPSILCWGLSNEITASGGVNEDMIGNHRTLNDLCHRLDDTRPTTMAHAFMLETGDPMVFLPDIRSYNLYFGWYNGDWNMNDDWFDEFHAQYPDQIIGLSEYGADANPQYQSAHPEKGDYTEGYQALYHEHMLQMWRERPYIWAMHCWNMFDFGAAGRKEGGKIGQNQKGLVTFDRKTRKDAFYIYKAYLSREPFVHLCGRRYADRTEEVTEIRVYSNLSEVTLSVDGREVSTKTGDKIFVFEVPISGEHVIEAKAGGALLDMYGAAISAGPDGSSAGIADGTNACASNETFDDSTPAAGAVTDFMTIRKVDRPNPSYSSTDSGEVVNWFDKPEEVMREGYYSIMDTMEDLKRNPETAAILAEIIAKASASYGEVAKGIKVPDSVQKMMDREPLNKTLKQVRKAITPAMIKEYNYRLNQVKKTQ